MVNVCFVGQMLEPLCFSEGKDFWEGNTKSILNRLQRNEELGDIPSITGS